MTQIKEEVLIEYLADTRDAVQELAKLAKANQKAEESTKEYKGSIDDMLEALGPFGRGISSAKRALDQQNEAMKKGVSGLGKFKRALGPIAVVLAAVAAAAALWNNALKSNANLQETVDLTLTGLKGGIDAVTDSIGNATAEWLGFNKEIETTNENAAKSIGFWQAVGNTLKAVAPQIAGLAETFTDGAVAATEAERQAKLFAQTQAEYNLTVARERREIALLIETTRELTTTRTEGQAILEEALRRFDALTQVQLNREKERLAAAKAAFDASNEGTEGRFKATKDLLQAEADFFEVEKRISGQRRELLNRIKENQAGLIKEQKALNDERERQIFLDNAQVEQLETNTDLIVSSYDAQTEAVNRLNRAQDDQNRSQKERDKENAESQKAAIDAILEDYDNMIFGIAAAGDALGSFGQISSAILGEGAALTKVFSVFQVVAAQTRAIAEEFARPSFLPGPSGLAEKIGRVAIISGAVGALVAQIKQLSVPQTFAAGGMVHGPSHAHGGVKFAGGGRVIELEGGEAVINKRSTSMYKPLLSSINSAGGGVKFADGGLLPGMDNSLNASSLRRAFASIPNAVLVVEDFNRETNKINVNEQRARL